MAGRLVEGVPAQEIRLDLRGQLLDEPRGAAPGHKFLDALDTDEIDHVLGSVMTRPSTGSDGGRAMVVGPRIKI